MKEVLVKTTPKDSFKLVVSDNSANIQTTFSPPLYLQANRDYELAMVNLESYFSFANIRKGNNSFKWKKVTREMLVLVDLQDLLKANAMLELVVKKVTKGDAGGIGPQVRKVVQV